MDKITYLIGAGASADTVPIINDFANGFKELYNLNVHLRKQVTSASPIAQQEYITQSFELIMKDCVDFEKGAIESVSVDKYAFLLFQTRKKDELKRLKVLISLIVTYNSLTKPIDKRYDDFFQRILASNTFNGFKNHYRIISWNYDFLFERAYKRYSQDDTIRGNQKLLHINGYGDAGNQPKGSFELFKINGTTSFYESAGSKSIDLKEDFTWKSDFDFVQKMIHIYSRITRENELECDLLFAFEEKYLEEEMGIIDKAIKAIEGSSALIIIGYSFPNPNVAIDRRILESLGNIKYVYLQTKEAERFYLYKIKDIVEINDEYLAFRDIEYFHVPTRNYTIS